MEVIRLSIMECVLLGIILSIATGFRIFLPLLFLSGAHLTGIIELGASLEWIGNVPVFVIILVATLLEIIAYFIPIVDSTMDAIDTPIAVIAGILVMFSVVPLENELTHWLVSILVGGTLAGVIKACKALFRAGIAVLTGGTGNFLVATFELGATIFLGVVAYFFIV